MTYFTAWVEDDGKLKTFADIYGHESRIALGMEGKAHLIAAQGGQGAGAAPTRSPACRRRRAAAAKKDWIRRVFEN